MSSVDCLRVWLRFLFSSLDWLLSTLPAHQHHLGRFLRAVRLGPQTRGIRLCRWPFCALSFTVFHMLSRDQITTKFTSSAPGQNSLHEFLGLGGGGGVTPQASGVLLTMTGFQGERTLLACASLQPARVAAKDCCSCTGLASLPWPSAGHCLQSHLSVPFVIPPHLTVATYYPTTLKEASPTSLLIRPLSSRQSALGFVPTTLLLLESCALPALCEMCCFGSPL